MVRCVEHYQVSVTTTKITTRRPAKGGVLILLISTQSERSDIARRTEVLSPQLSILSDTTIIATQRLAATLKGRTRYGACIS
jgi:hypothetical protein